MLNFLKWLTLSCIFATFYATLEFRYGFFTEMANSDPYYICHALWGLFLFIIIEALYYSNTDKRVEKLATLSFIASLAGLLGTFLGLAGAFAQVDVTSLDPANVEEVRKTMSEMFSNMRLAMNTSITGMFVSLPALAYMYFLGEKTKEGN